MDLKKGKEIDILGEIASKFQVEGEVRGERRIWISIDKEILMDSCNWLKEQGFEHLSAISVIDWIEEQKYELAYHLWSYQGKILLTLKVKVDRQNAVIDSVTRVWDGSAQAHEREMHELFGVKFEGNNNLTPLFLEDWSGPPPFRKDFDWREYVRREYYNEQNERERAYYD